MQEIDQERGLRFEKLLKSLNIKQRAAAQMFKISTSFISNVINGQKDISRRLIEEINKNYPNVNISWLLTGEGDMLIQDKTGIMEEPGVGYGYDEGGPSMETVERLMQEAQAAHPPQPALTTRQLIRLQEACYRALVDNAGKPWSAMLAAASVYLAFIEAFPQVPLPPREDDRPPGDGNGG